MDESRRIPLAALSVETGVQAFQSTPRHLVAVHSLVGDHCEKVFDARHVALERDVHEHCLIRRMTKER